MPDTPTFVVNDRRKFTADGDLRHDAQPEQTAVGADLERSAEANFSTRPQLVTEEPSSTSSNMDGLADMPEADALGDLNDEPVFFGSQDDPAVGMGDEQDISDDTSLPAGPTAVQAAEAARAYEATLDRLDTALRAANPGADRLPPMSFDRLVQSLYTQALILLGGGAQPGETPRVDILGARDTIDMLSVMEAKTKGNLSPSEQQLLESALFDLRMGFLEITQALARQAAQRQGSMPGSAAPGGLPPMGSGPRIVR